MSLVHHWWLSCISRDSGHSSRQSARTCSNLRRTRLCRGGNTKNADAIFYAVPLPPPTELPQIIAPCVTGVSTGDSWALVCQEMAEQGIHGMVFLWATNMMPACLSKDKTPETCSLTPLRLIYDRTSVPTHSKHKIFVYHLSMLDQRRRRWVDAVQNVIQMFCVCWVTSYVIFQSKKAVTSYIWSKPLLPFYHHYTQLQLLIFEGWLNAIYLYFMQEQHWTNDEWRKTSHMYIDGQFHTFYTARIY